MIHESQKAQGSEDARVRRSGSINSWFEVGRLENWKFGEEITSDDPRDVPHLRRANYTKLHQATPSQISEAEGLLYYLRH
jgi:hypothetical protein